MSALPISSLHAALDEVLAAVAGLEPAVVLEAMQQVERFRNRLPLLDHALIARATLVGLAERQCFSTLEKLMVSALRISPAEAKRRTRAAAALSVGSPDLGGRVRLPELAAAQAAGEVSPDQVGLVERALWQVDVVDPGQRRAAEITLVDYARVFAPPELHRICARLVDDLDPDGARPRELVQHDLRGLCLTHRKDGMVAVDGRLTPAAGAQLQAVLGPLARPRQTTEPGPAGGQRPVPDPRSPAQRLHDALEDACARLLKSPDLPASGGTPATVIITMDLAALQTGLGTGQTTTGETLSVREALRIAGEAEIVPTVCAAGGRPLHLGRTRRLATTAQTFALVARDGGCSFPGCDVRPEWCDRHHIQDWLSGGPTDIDNLTLLCRYHHTHFAATGWTCTLNPAGLPTWQPPGQTHRNRAPMLNHRLRQRHQPSG